MKVVLLQMDSQWDKPLENIRRAEALMLSQPGADLYVLPEMWATGFMTRPSLDDTNPALAWMERMASKYDCALCGSLAVKVGSQDYRNRCYFVTPDKVFYYDKHHLFTHGHEDDHYQAGTSHTIVTWRGVRFLLLVCYDLRFPIWARYGYAGEYDAIIYVANWPKSRQEAWQILTHARAIENQCYVIAVNRVGSDPNVVYQGGSMMIDPIGRDIVTDTKHTESSLSGQLCMLKLEESRHRFRVLLDRDVIADGIDVERVDSQ